MKTNTYYSKKTRNKFMSLFFNPYLLKGLEVVNAYELKVREIIDYGDVIKRYRFDDIVQYDLMLDNRRIFPGVYEPVIQFIDDLLTVMTLDELLHVKWSRWEMAIRSNNDLPEIIASMGIITEKVRNDLTASKILSQYDIGVMNELFGKRRNKIRIESYLLHPPLRSGISHSFDRDLKQLIDFLKTKGIESIDLDFLTKYTVEKAIKEIPDVSVKILDQKVQGPIRVHYLVRLYAGQALREIVGTIEDINLNSSTYKEFVLNHERINFFSNLLKRRISQIIVDFMMIALADKPVGRKELWQVNAPAVEN